MKCPFFVLGTLLCFSVYAQHRPVRVAVVGGGMAGVSSAHHIHKFDPQASVTLFEKEPVAGGNAKTVTVPNRRGEMVKVDMGPQYFTEGPWNEYIRFMKEYDLYHPEKTSEFTGSISIQEYGRRHPRLVTPLGGSLRGEKLGQLLHFKKFCDAAFHVYKNQDGTHAECIGDWVKSLEGDSAFRNEVTFPFLAASLGTSVENIKKTSTLEIIKLFAFRRPSEKNTFKVMHEGMGTIIRQIADALAGKGIRVLTASPVQQVRHQGNGYTVAYTRDGETREEPFDFVVLAVHADQAYRLLKSDTGFHTVTPLLKELEYFRARIVLHNDSGLVNTAKPAFLNVITTPDHEVVANTMNLGMVADRYAGIYKSWLTEELCDRVKANGCFFHEEIFYHPLITPAFKGSLLKLDEAVGRIKNLFVGGGWTQGLETQESAVVSGKTAMEKYKKYKLGSL